MSLCLSWMNLGVSSDGEDIIYNMKVHIKLQYLDMM